MGPNVLLFDIETAPLVADLWSMWQEGVSLNQIHKDWHVLSWSAKWLDKKPIMYQDQRNSKDISDDSRILKSIWKLLDQADIVITQNGKKFDQRKLQARFIVHGMQPPSSYRHLDTKQIAKKHFAFTSYKLEYMCEVLNIKHKKQKHHKFPGHELWTACIANNPKAWAEMEKYNKYDVLALEEVYKKLAPWDSTINFSIYNNSHEHTCSCGSKKIQNDGHAYLSIGVYQRYRCARCGSRWRSGVNLLSKEKRKSLLRRAD